MKTPKYTDLHRYPRGWSRETNVAETFQRIRERQQAEAERERQNNLERLQKVISVKRGSK